MEECRTIGSAAEPSSLGEGHLFVSPTESAEAPDHASHWKRRICPHPQGGSGLTVGKGPHGLPTAHFPPFPSTLSSMEGGSPSSWPPASLHTHSPLACLGAVRTEPTRPCITVVTMHRPQCQPWEALDVPPPGPTPELFLCVQRTLCPSSAMDRASPSSASAWTVPVNFLL